MPLLMLNANVIRRERILVEFVLAPITYTDVATSETDTEWSTIVMPTCPLRTSLDILGARFPFLYRLQNFLRAIDMRNSNRV